MQCNVGNADRLLRAALGLGIVFAGVYHDALWGMAGVALLLTAAFRWCPAYVPFKFKSK